MSDLAVLLLATAVAYLPGTALLYLLGHRRPLLLLALAPAATVSVAGVLALITTLPGLSYGPIGLLLATAALAAGPLVTRWRARRAGAAAVVAAVVAAPSRPAPDRPGLLVGVLMVLVGIGFGLWTWLRGLGGLSTPPQEHDMVIHAMQTAYIMRSGHAAPWQLVPADVVSGEPVSFYPSGIHLLAAAVAGMTGDAVRSLNAMTVVFLAVVICVGVAAVGAVAARQLGLSVRSGLLVGGVAALVMAGMYRPVYHLMHDGGILANAAALAAVPGVLAGLLWLPRMRRPAAAGVGMAAAGAVWIHPTAAVSIVLTALLWWAGQLVSPFGRRRLRGLIGPLLVAAAVGTVLLVPAVGPGLATAGRTGAFPPDTTAVSFGQALGSTFGFPYSGWIDQAQSRSQVWAVLLLALGVLTVVALRRGLGPVTAWAGWSVIVMGAWVSPGSGFDAPITGFYYNAMLRVWSHVALLAPVLAGLGVVLVADRVAVLARRRIPVPARWTALALTCAGFVGYAVLPAAGYAQLNEESVATRYRTPDFVRVGPDDQRAIDWLATRVRPGERVFNSPNDGSTYLYVERGIPIVNVYTLGLPGVPYSYRLLESFNTYPTDPAVRQQLRDLDVRWVYVDSQAPGIGSVGSPEGWAGEDGFTLAPGLADLDGLPGLTVAFRAGSVTVYALDLERAVAPAALPAVDLNAARSRVGTAEQVQALTFERAGTTAVEGSVVGNRTSVWAVPVAAGQTLTVRLQSTDPALSVNVLDVADAGGAPLHDGTDQGSDATIVAARDGVYLIQPFQPRAAAGRGDRGDYTLTVGRR